MDLFGTKNVWVVSEEDTKGTYHVWLLSRNEVLNLSLLCMCKILIPARSNSLRICEVMLIMLNDNYDVPLIWNDYITIAIIVVCIIVG